MNMEMYKKFADEWNQFYRQTKKELWMQDQIHILSPVYMDRDVVRFLELIPTDHFFPNLPKKKKSVINPQPEDLEFIRSAGMAIRYEGEFLLVDRLLFKSFGDLYGFAEEAIRSFESYDGTGITVMPRDEIAKAGWRNAYLAELFKNGSYEKTNEKSESVYATIRKVGKRRIVYAFHRSALDALGTNLKGIVDHMVNNYGADIRSWDFSNRRCVATLEFPNRSRFGWNQGIVIRDSDIGLESLSVYAAWIRKSAVFYTDQIRYRHRTPVSEEKIFSDLDGMLKREFSEISIDLDFHDVKARISQFLGVRKYHNLCLHMAKITGSALEKMSSFATGKEELDEKYRLMIGGFLKGVTGC